MLLSRSNKADLDLNLLRFSECSYIFHRLLDIIRCNTHKPKSKTCTVDNNLQMKIFESYKNTEAFLLRTFTRNRKVHNIKTKVSLQTPPIYILGRWTNVVKAAPKQLFFLFLVTLFRVGFFYP